MVNYSINRLIIEGVVQMKNEFIVYQSKGKQFLLIIAAIVMVSLSFIVIFMSRNNENGTFYLFNYLYPIIGIFGVLFFGFGAIYLMKELVGGKQLVVLTQDGFYDYSSAMATKHRLIPWKDVLDIAVFSTFGQPFITVKLKNAEAFLASLSPLHRKAVQANLKLGAYEISITVQQAKGVSLNQLLEQMILFWQNANEEHESFL
jgi:hypothetical protein